MTSDADWTWKFAPRAADQFDGLDAHVQDRIVSKLDEIVDSEWRDPDDFLEPLTGGPFSKLRVGQYRLLASPRTRTRSSKSIGSNIGAGRTLPTTDVSRPGATRGFRMHCDPRSRLVR